MTVYLPNDDDRRRLEEMLRLVKALEPQLRKAQRLLPGQLAPRERDELICKVTSVTETGIDDPNGNPVQWTCGIAEVIKTKIGYAADAWEELPNGYSADTAYIWDQYGNAATGQQRNKIDVSGTLWGEKAFQFQPPNVGDIVRVKLIPVTNGSAVELEPWIISETTTADGECS